MKTEFNPRKKAKKIKNKLDIAGKIAKITASKGVLSGTSGGIGTKVTYFHTS